MVKLTIEYIERKCSEAQLKKSLSRRWKKSQLWSTTHLRMNDMFISSIGNFSAFKNLKVIYLQNNNISRIENLHFALNLTHLYLQHNAITKIENLDLLRHLKTLYLGYNSIVVVEGLENLQNLTDLHVENQKIPIGESLCFDPRSILTLSNCLKVFNISGNRITSLNDIQNLYELEVLDARNNLIDDIDDLTECIRSLISLKDLSFQGNPVTQRYRFKENLIANNTAIRTLNGKVITDACRSFMKRFQIEKHLNYTKKSSCQRKLDEDITSSLNLPPAFKKSISRAMFQNLGPKLSISISAAIGDVQPQIFPPWKTASGTNAMRGNRTTPRPFWGNTVKGSNQPHVTRSLTNSKTIMLPSI